ncbi:ABC transporter substrate-binding protein [Caldalkalibacillus salinus]|uniref:ABC transporter substrate-binding protein n=1 Tax=Caldalkalibacillus salinus TaxID=2803787 RepID=UPI0019227F4B|nr:sugar ABC transporter substrate-binding protein [Caldalkalibacillus salinus]
MNQFLRYLGFVMLVGVMLAGCTGENKSNESEDIGKGDGTSGEIKVAAWNLAADALSQTADAFMAAYPDTQVTVEYVTSDYDSIIPPLTAGRGAPDIVQIQQRDFPNFLERFPNQFVDISEQLGDHKDEFAETAWLQVEKEGVPYAVPWDLGPVGVYYRTDYFEQAGIDPDTLTTWDAFIEAGKQLQNERDGVYMMAHDTVSGDITDVWYMLLNQLGGQFYDADGRINFTHEANIKALEMTKRFNEEGIVLNASSWDDRIRAVANGQTATMIYPVWYAGTIKTQAEDQEGKWGVMPLPAFTEDGPNQANLGGSVLAITEQSDNKALAWKFLAFTLLTNEGQDIQMAHGLFPSWQPYYETEKFKATDDYFGIPLSDFFGQVSTEIPPLEFGAHFLDFQKPFEDATADVMAGQKSAEEALRDAEQQAARATGLDISE